MTNATTFTHLVNTSRDYIERARALIAAKNDALLVADNGDRGEVQYHFRDGSIMAVCLKTYEAETLESED